MDGDAESIVSQIGGIGIREKSRDLQSVEQICGNPVFDPKVFGPQVYLALFQMAFISSSEAASSDDLCSLSSLSTWAKR